MNTLATISDQSAITNPWAVLALTALVGLVFYIGRRWCAAQEELDATIETLLTQPDRELDNDRRGGAL